MKLHFVQRSMESHHFESQSAPPPLTPEPPLPPPHFEKSGYAPEKKKMFVCPFPTDPKFWETCFCFVFCYCFLFVFFFCLLLLFFWILSIAFLNNIVINAIVKIHSNSPKSFLCRHRRYYVFTPYMSPTDCLMSLV